MVARRSTRPPLHVRLMTAQVIKERKASRARIASARRVTQVPTMTYLEQRSVTQKTLDQYKHLAQAFLTWCQNAAFDWSGAEGLDLGLALFFDHAFFQGKPGSVGEKTLASMKFFFPALSRHGATDLPRAHRAVKSWSKLSPGLQRLPLPAVCVAAICGKLIADGMPWQAFFVLTGFLAYLRPSENTGLKVKCLVPPLEGSREGAPYSTWSLNLHPCTDGVPGKTGIMDETVLLDGPVWMDAWYQRLRTGRPADAPLWPFDVGTATQFFMDTWKALRMDPVAPSLYALRHGGASEDLLAQRRTPEGVLRRGRWRTNQSLKRYGKEAKLMAQVSLIPATTLNFGEKVLGSLEAAFNGGVALHPPTP